MKLYIYESEQEEQIQLIDVPMQSLFYKVVDVGLQESLGNTPIVTRDQTDFSKCKENGYNFGNIFRFKDYLEFRIVKGLENAYSKSCRNRNIANAISVVKSNKDTKPTNYKYYDKNKPYKSYIRKSESNTVKDNIFSFAFYLDLYLNYNKTKYKLNSEFEEYITKFTVRFADHVTIEYQGERYLMNDNDTILANVMLIDSSNNALVFDNIVKSLEIIFNYRLNILNVLDYLVNKYDNNLTFITEENVDEESDRKFSELLKLFAENKMQPEKLKLTDYVDYKKYKNKYKDKSSS